MENNNWKKRMLQTIKEKDSRFWLMIFVVVSTLTIFTVWSVNIKKVFSEDRNLSNDTRDLKIDGSKNNLNEIVSDFSVLLDQAKNVETEEEKKDSLSVEELAKIKEAVSNKIAIQEETSTTSSTTVTSTDPVLSLELDESDQRIKKIKEAIQDSDEKLGE